MQKVNDGASRLGITYWNNLVLGSCNRGHSACGNSLDLTLDGKHVVGLFGVLAFALFCFVMRVEL